MTSPPKKSTAGAVKDSPVPYKIHGFTCGCGIYTPMNYWGSNVDAVSFQCSGCLTRFKLVRDDE